MRRRQAAATFDRRLAGAAVLLVCLLAAVPCPAAIGHGRTFLLPGVLLAPDSAGGYWRTDLVVFNAAFSPVFMRLALLTDEDDGLAPFTIGPYRVNPHGTLLIADVLDTFVVLGKHAAVAGLLIELDGIDTRSVAVVGRTRSLGDAGAKGYAIAASELIGDWAHRPAERQWLPGIREDGTVSVGWGAELSLVNAGPEGTEVRVTALNQAGGEIGPVWLSLPAFTYLHEPIAALLGPLVVGAGELLVSAQQSRGPAVAVFATVIDRVTGDPTMVPAQSARTGAVLVPSVARVSGERGTVWRTRASVANVGEVEAAWSASLRCRPPARPPAPRQFALPPGFWLVVEDLVAALYEPEQPPETAGCLVIDPVDQPLAPVGLFASYNVTGNGSHGQALPVLGDSAAARASGPRRLLLTALSSEQVARSNLALANLGESPAAFETYLYDERGTVLNPFGRPMRVELPAGGWDQDKLENRFRNAGWAPPAGLRLISVEVRVTAGAGWAGASVVDPGSGDPDLITPFLAP